MAKSQSSQNDMSLKSNLQFSQRLQYGIYHALDHFVGSEKGFSLTKNSRRRYYRNLLAYLKERGEGQVLPIERRSNLSVKEFKAHYLKKGIPVVLENAAKDWSCVKKWSFSYFKELHGEDEIVVADQEKIENEYLHTTLAEVIDGINTGNGRYYRFYPLLQKHPEHILDFDYKWLKAHRNSTALFESFQVFLGGDKTLTPIHSANLCNLFTQVVGEKQWYLYHHHNTAIIDPKMGKKIYRSAPHKKPSGPFNPFQADYSSPYELFRYINGFTAHLKPGDVLWNPPFYWHAVQNQGMSIGVGYRWFSPFYCFKISALYSLLDFLVFDPPIWKSLKVAKEDGNFIHLLETGRLEEYLSKKGKKAN